MSNGNETSINELADRINELDKDKRIDLLKTIQEERLKTFLEIRADYFERLKENELIAPYPENVEQLKENDSITQFPEGSLWADHCERVPEDPICQQIFSYEELEQVYNYRYYLPPSPCCYMEC